jgi:hypothetical protein
VDAEQQNDWRSFYQAALLELDPVRLPERIERAYIAIQICLTAHSNGNSPEYQALADALANLRVLKREIASAKDAAPETRTAVSTRVTPP